MLTSKSVMVLDVSKIKFQFVSNQALAEISAKKQADAKTVLESQPQRSFATGLLPSATPNYDTDCENYAPSVT